MDNENTIFQELASVSYRYFGTGISLTSTKLALLCLRATVLERKIYSSKTGI